MKKEIPSSKRVVVLFLVGAGFAFLSVFPMQWWLLIPYILIFTALQFSYFLYGIQLRRSLFFERWLATDSGLQRWKKVGKVCYLTIFVLSLALSIVTSVALFTYKWTHTLALLGGIAFGLLLAGPLSRWVIRHANVVYQPLLQYRWTTALAVFMGASSLIAWELTINRDDHTNLSATHAADTVIELTNHPIRPVQHFSRTIHYSSLSLLRLRDSLGSPGGTLIYAYLILPNLIPFLGVVAAIRGLRMMFENRFLATEGKSKSRNCQEESEL